MTSPALAVATAAAVFTLVRGHAPPARVAQLRRRTSVPRPPRPSRGRTGWVVLLGAAVVLVDPVLPLVALGGALLLRRWRRVRLRRARDHQRDVEADLPDVLDLLALVVGAGTPLPGALPITARWGPPALCPALDAAARAIGAGVPVVAAVDELQVAWGEAARPLVRAAADHLRHGTPFLPVLGRLGRDARARRGRHVPLPRRRATRGQRLHPTPNGGTTMYVHVVAAHALALSLLDQLDGRIARAAGRVRAGRRAGGQSTAEYALVLLGAATVAIVFIAWAGKTSRIGKLFDAVLDTVIGKV